MRRDWAFKVPQPIDVIEEEHLHISAYGVHISVSATNSTTEKGVSTKYMYSLHDFAQHQPSALICSKEFTQKAFDYAKRLISGFMDYDVGDYYPQESCEILQEVYFEFERKWDLIFSDTSAVSPDRIKNHSKKDDYCHYEINRMRYPHAPLEAWSWFDKNVVLLIEQIKELAEEERKAGNMQEAKQKKSLGKALKGLLERYFK